MASETPSFQGAKREVSPSPARTAALMASYIALSSVVAVTTDILLAWAFARVQAIAERRTAPCGCQDADEQLAELLDVEDVGEGRVRILVDTTAPANPYAEPIGEQLQADNAGGEL